MGYDRKELYYRAAMASTFPGRLELARVILIIGVALLPVAANDIVLGTSPAAIQNPVLLPNLVYALGTLGPIVVIQRVFTGFVATVAVLVGLVVGTVVAWALGDAHFGEASSADWLGYTTPFCFGMSTFSTTATISMLIVMIITMVETTSDVYATGEIVQKRIQPEDIARAIRADGMVTFRRRTVRISTFRSMPLRPMSLKSSQERDST